MGSCDFLRHCSKKRPANRRRKEKHGRPSHLLQENSARRILIPAFWLKHPEDVRLTRAQRSHAGTSDESINEAGLRWEPVQWNLRSPTLTRSDIPYPEDWPYLRVRATRPLRDGRGSRDECLPW